MIKIECPNCGFRNVQEYRFGGEFNPRPKDPKTVTDEAWVDYIYMRDNHLGIQKEWWYHRSGCGLWFIVERHTRTNQVLKTYLWSPE